MGRSDGSIRWVERGVEQTRVRPGAEQQERPVAHTKGREAFELRVHPVGDANVAGDLRASVTAEERLRVRRAVASVVHVQGWIDRHGVAFVGNRRIHPSRQHLRPARVGIEGDVGIAGHQPFDGGGGRDIPGAGRMCGSTAWD